MPLNEETVYAALRGVKDPELMVNVVDLGLIYGVAIEEAAGRSNVGLVMTMTTPACPYAPQLLQEVRDVLGSLDDVGEVRVELSLNPPWTPERMSVDARDELGMF